MKKLALATMLAVGLTGCSSSEETQVLNLYNWSEYMPQEVLDRFTEETGIQVVYTTYDSNEAMYARLKLLDDGAAYDLAVPSTYYVSKMRQEDLLMPIDRSKIEGFDNISPELVNLDIDPENAYSVPFLWGTTGLGVDTSDVEGEVTAWADLWDERFEGRIVLTNDMREVFHVALRVLGHSGNSTDPEQIEEAYEKLTELMPSVRTFNSDAPRMPFLEGETDIGMIWNGEAVMGRDALPTLEYVYPAEGIIAWLDSFVIPKNAKNPEAAHKFISFVLKPEISALISEDIGYATPNLAARELLDESIASDRASYPTAEDMINAEFQTDIGDEALQVYAKYWEKLKSGL
ncbi:spermidine/putrescine-binding periplasmic protein [Marinobacter sp. JH2]|uniref:extracellular solute-binding protein n=1 Tax=Marinobacter sp. AL4B TaxID=2871173 RepID=UPI0010543B85|nr:MULTISPECIES: extracellular solute-binding protein [unclassified Marinobacter]MBZ0335585.1 extracellular solute-binding protein [Marinobacter sp. AL4B]QBM18418.1 spermidine/putrescine-binding periplasmic protein [Marinobacter sp. JH2]